MAVSCAWYGKAIVKSIVSGTNSLSFGLEGSLVLTVFLSELASKQQAGGAVIPQNSVAGRMSGTFDAEVSTRARRVKGTGTAEWTIGGRYDPSEETVAIAIHSSGVDARGTETALEGAAEGATPAEQPFSTRLYWGLHTPVRYYWEPRTPKADDVSTILEVMKPPAAPVIPSGREADAYMVDSIPQVGLNALHPLVLDLKDPKPQTVTQTSLDAVALGDRVTTWTFTLVPNYSIERVDRGPHGHNSFVSTDFINFRITIPGVTVAKSGWADLPSWEVKALGPFSENVVPNQLQHSTTFGFKPNPTSRPTNGSTARNRPMQYTVSAALGSIVQYFILTQDTEDLLRQEYIDHNEGVSPSRADCVAHPIDNSFNVGNYDLVIDGGMQVAFDKVTLEFGKDSKDGLRVVAGFRCPQRNKATGDFHPNNKHTQGRALDLVPNSAGAGAMLALYQACVKAGYHSFCESAPGTQVPAGSPNAKHVHIDW